jgi:hypothetical protein
MRQLRFATLAIFALIFSYSGYGQSLAEFEALVKESGMSLNIPSIFVESPVVANKNMDYEYAVKYPDKDFILRFAIRPIQSKVYPNDSIKKDVESKIKIRNTTYEANMKSVLYAISGGYDYEFKAFDKAAAKDEFNADWGAITLVELRSEFGKGYRFCMVVALHKDSVADAYLFFLSNKQDSFPAGMRPLFHSLRFE